MFDIYKFIQPTDDKQDVRRKCLIMLLIRNQGVTRTTQVQHTFCHFKALKPRSNIFVQHYIAFVLPMGWLDD